MKKRYRTHNIGGSISSWLEPLFIALKPGPAPFGRRTGGSGGSTGPRPAMANTARARDEDEDAGDDAPKLRRVADELLGSNEKPTRFVWCLLWVLGPCMI